MRDCQKNTLDSPLDKGVYESNDLSCYMQKKV